MIKEKMPMHADFCNLGPVDVPMFNPETKRDVGAIEYAIRPCPSRSSKRRRAYAPGASSTPHQSIITSANNATARWYCAISTNSSAECASEMEPGPNNSVGVFA